MLQAGCLLQHAAPSLLLASCHASKTWAALSRCSSSSSSSTGKRLRSSLTSANPCIASLTSVQHGRHTLNPLNTTAEKAATQNPHTSSSNSSSGHSLLHNLGSSTARILQQQQQQQWGVRSYSQSTTPTAAPAQPQQQQQEQPAVPSASEAATSSFINAPAATAAASGTPAAAAGAAVTAAAAAASVGGVLAGAATAELKEYSMRQVSKHASDETCWIVVNGKVYDVTSYIDDHPGGADSILQNAGVDCTDEFMGVHSQEAKELLEKFIIGTVKPGTKKPAKQPAVVFDLAAAAAADSSVPLVTLQSPTERYALPLAKKQRLNHDTYFMRFALPSPRAILGLPCGKHVFLCADIGGEGVVRAYTPISGDRDPGVLEFLIKVYWAGENPKFPEGGKMTQHLAAMKEGDTIDVKGPYGKFHYEGHGKYTLNRVPGQARYMSMISGGSGITPCYSVLREVLRDPSDTTRCSLIYANKHEEDIWLKQELDTMARDNPERFHLWYVVEEPGTAPSPLTHGEDADAVAAAALLAESAPWTYSKGFITPDMMAQHLLPPQPLVLPSSSSQQQQQQQGGSLALMCGPPGMLEHVVVPGLSAMGYTAQQMVVF